MIWEYVLIIYLLDHINRDFVEEQLVINSIKYRVFFNIYYVFQVAGIGMMLFISVLRYRATVHPLKPAISRRKLKVVCGLVYIVAFIAGYGTYLPLCFKLRLRNNVAIVYQKFYPIVTLCSGFTSSQQYLWLWYIVK